MFVKDVLRWLRLNPAVPRDLKVTSMSSRKLKRPPNALPVHSLVKGALYEDWKHLKIVYAPKYCAQQNSIDEASSCLSKALIVLVVDVPAFRYPTGKHFEALLIPSFSLSGPTA